MLKVRQNDLKIFATFPSLKARLVIHYCRAGQSKLRGASVGCPPNNTPAPLRTLMTGKLIILLDSPTSLQQTLKLLLLCSEAGLAGKQVAAL